jgi:hypothetical protein
MANSSDAGRSYFANSSKLKIGKKIILTATLTELTKYQELPVGAQQPANCNSVR